MEEIKLNHEKDLRLFIENSLSNNFRTLDLCIKSPRQPKRSNILH